MDGGIGATAVMYRPGQGPKTLRFNLGTPVEHMVFEAEAVGVVLALHMLRYERHAKRAVIQLDNQAVLGALSSHKPKPSQAIIDEII